MYVNNISQDSNESRSSIESRTLFKGLPSLRAIDKFRVARAQRDGIRASLDAALDAGVRPDVQPNFDQTTIADAVSSSGDVQNGPTDD